MLDNRVFLPKRSEIFTQLWHGDPDAVRLQTELRALANPSRCSEKSLVQTHQGSSGVCSLINGLLKPFRDAVGMHKYLFGRAGVTPPPDEQFLG